MAGLPNSSNALQQWHRLFEAQGGARSAQAEHPGRMMLIDSDGSLDAHAVIGCGEPQVVVRGGMAYAARLRPVRADSAIALPAGGFLQAAQTIAIREENQRVVPEHLLKALLEDEQGMAAGLIERAGGDPRRAVADTDAALAKIPAVSGSGAQQTPGLDNDAVRVLDQAEQVAQKAGDSYVTVERLLLALAIEKDTEAGRILAKAGVTLEKLLVSRRGEVLYRKP